MTAPVVNSEPPIVLGNKCLSLLQLSKETGISYRQVLDMSTMPGFPAVTFGKQVKVWTVDFFLWTKDHFSQGGDLRGTIERDVKVARK